MNDELFLIDKNKSLQLLEDEMGASTLDIIERILLFRKGHTLGRETIQALKKEGRL